MTTYSATLDNQTQSTWTLVVYLTIPTSPTLASVAWKMASAAPSGSRSVSWDDGYGVALATLNGTVYQQNLVQASDPGKAWNVVTQGGAVQFSAAGPAMTPTTLQVNNTSGQTITTGLAFGGTGAVYKSGLVDGVNQQFSTTVSFWVLLADTVRLGELVQQGAANSALISSFVGPQPVQFPGSQPNLIVTATQDGGGVDMALSYSATVGGS